MSETTFNVEGMDCAHCAATIENGVRKLDGVHAVAVNYVTGKLMIDGEVDADALRQRIETLGYRLAGQDAPTPEIPERKRGGVLGFFDFMWAERNSRFALIGGALLALGAVAALLGQPASIIFVAATLIALYPIARSGLGNLWVNHDFNINLLMTIAAIGALLIGEWAEGATVVFLFAVGEALEGYTGERARDSIRGLMTLAPAQATRLRDGHEDNVPVAALVVGDTILVKPGERLPMDGEVTRGDSGVDQAPITGESVPVHKGAGDVVYAGTINGSGALEIRVTRLAADNTLSRIIRMVEDAQNSRAPSQRFIDRFAHYYTPAIALLALVIAVAPPLLFHAPFLDTAAGHGWLYRALTLLVIACPCALVISTPVTVISAITAAARRGVLIKGGAHLEALAAVRTLAFDKTGTLTAGKPVVTISRSVDCMSGVLCPDCDDVLALATAVERRSTHPLARAVVDEAKVRGLADCYAPAEAVESLAGRGVQGRVDGKLVTVGSHTLFEATLPHPQVLCDMVDVAEAHGQTAMLLSDGDRVRGFIAVADSARPESKAVIKDLKGLGCTTIMLTGDNVTVAAAVGQTVGVDDVRAGLLPEDKVEAIRALLSQRGAVAMVGDGVNDTPALAAATIGIAMGGAGSAQALETADIALMADDLTQLPAAIRLARFARRLIVQNITASFAVKIIFVLLALLGIASLWLAILADVGVLLLVTLNGMRPLRFQS